MRVNKQGLGFERGKDPYSAMDIGGEEKKFIGNELYKIYGMNFIRSLFFKNDSIEIVSGGLTYQGFINFIENSIGSKWFSSIEELSEEKEYNRVYRLTIKKEYKKIFQENFGAFGFLKYRMDEGLKFERNKDPHSAMGIGISITIKKGLHRIVYSLLMGQLKYNFRTNSISIYSRLNYENFKKKIEELIGTKWFSDIKLKYDEKNRELKSETYYLKVKDEYKNIFRENFGVSGFLRYDEDLSLDEGLNFERNLDPKKGMEIGKTYTDKKFIEESDLNKMYQDLHFRYEDKNFKIEELIKDYNGYPIVAYSHENHPLYEGKRFGAFSTFDSTHTYNNINSAIKEMQFMIDDKINREQILNNIFDSRLVKESLDFNREGSPYKKMGIGKNFKIKDALDQTRKENQNYKYFIEWIKENPTLEKALIFKDDGKDVHNILYFDEDWYCYEQNEDPSVDPESLKKEFILIKRLPTSPGEINLEEGQLQDGSKLFYYFNSAMSGYITRKEWLK